MPTLAPNRRRNRRFERAVEPPAFQLTERDIDILRLVARHRFLTSRQIQALIPGSAKRLLFRLTGLYHSGFLDRPRAQLDYYRTGSAPMVYALADRGAKLLNVRDGLDLVEIEWKAKNRAVGRPFIGHTLAVADVHVALAVACRDRPDVDLISDRQLVATFPQPPASPERAFTWDTQVAHNGSMLRISVKPDLAFGLRSPAISRRCYLVEVDRASMPIHRADMQQTSIHRKLVTYLQGYQDRLHERQFGWKALRILFLTDTTARADNMRIALAAITKAPQLRRLFYFAANDVLRGPLSCRWLDGNGEPQQLI
jgi:hypothetical protein